MNRRIVIVAVVLLITFSMRAWLSAAPKIPQRQQLATLPLQIGDWSAGGDQELSDKVQNVLKADDYLVRAYASPKHRLPADLYIAYYNKQQAGEAMHSPKNCLPGSGWEPVLHDYVQLADEGGVPQMVNRYVIEKDGQRALVLYWYQAHGRIIASEYWGKIYLVVDALTKNRRDGALVRITVPVIAKDVDGATEMAMNFAHGLYPELPKYLPN